jgi:site-specific DNA-methyltransferase (cytosine-N4-specific)
MGTAERLLAEKAFAKKYKGRINLIFTSPPFPLNRKKKYGNKKGDDYTKWLSGLAQSFIEYLAPTGSIVMELGNSWVEGAPVMSTLALKSLLAFLEDGKLHLCQQFIWHNPARLPTPAQWVNVERIRVKDSFTQLWWMSPTQRPKADNRRVLVKYSEAMKELLKTQKYNSGKRPSQHSIGRKSFLKNNGGSIPSNVIRFAHSDGNGQPDSGNVITLANTQASTPYLNYCRKYKFTPHPARMPDALPKFFIEFLTERGDLVLDPFGGSNTTGATAETLGRRWVTIEPTLEYIKGSRGRFTPAL